MSVIPWRPKPDPPSIYEHVRAHVRPDGPGLAEGGEKLPDDDVVRAKWNGARWAPGAREGVFARHVERPKLDEGRVGQIHAALIRLSDHPGGRARARVRRLFREEDVRRVIDAVIKRLSTYPPRNQARLYEEMKELLLRSGDREEVKVATALVGAFGNAEDAEIFRTLARHEEFTLYAAVALAKVVEDPVPELIELLPHVSDWGKTELSALLLRDPRPEVCESLLRRGLGFDNALELAVGCNLHDALAQAEIDDELLEGSAAILGSLTWDRDGQDDLFDYPEAGLAVERFLTHLAPRAQTVDHFLTTNEIRRYITGAKAEERAKAAERLGVKRDEAHDEKRRQEAGFSAPVGERVLELCDRILARSEWASVAATALESEDRQERWLGIQVAKRLGMPLHDYLVSQIEAHPNDYGLWFEFGSGADAGRIDEVIALAERVLDLEAIATGRAPERMAPFAVDGFDFILWELPRFPGKGRSFLRVALRSPVMRHRLIALRALARWPTDQITTEARAAIEDCLDDPDEDVREAARAVLAGEPIPERRPPSASPPAH